MKEFLVILFFMSSAILTQTRLDFTKEALMNFTQLAYRYTAGAEEFDLIVEGGYVLKLFHIPGDETKPVLLIHGAVDSADSFIMRGNTSLIAALANDHFDIWAINLRGSRYSRIHTTMNPDHDHAYWDFSVHEFGFIDIPSAIDFILSKTQQTKLNVIGYSEGTTSMLVMGALRPSYNDKVNVFIALAPICYLHNTKLYVAILMEMAPILIEAFKSIQNEEVLGFNTLIKNVLNAFCLEDTGYEFCIIQGLFRLTGAHESEIERDFLPVILGHFPAGTSRKNLEHLVQIRQRRRFVRYDYGESLNMVKYHRLTPPDYDLSRVTMKIALVVAQNDKLSTLRDVSLLKKKLPNVVSYKVMKDPLFNHVDYVWGKSTHTTLFPHISRVLNKYHKKIIV